MYVVFALVAVTQFNIEINAKVKYPTHLDITGKKNKARFISLVLICAMFAICWVAYIQWESTIASFTQSINISMAQYSVLWTINGIMILVAQPLIKPVLYLLKGNLKKQMFVGIIILCCRSLSRVLPKLYNICCRYDYFNFWRNVCMASSSNYSQSVSARW